MAKDTSKITFTTSLNSELVKKFRIYCSIKGKYQNEVIEQLIEKFLEKEGANQLIDELMRKDEMRKEDERYGDTNK